jgi:hypothetical protein
MKKLTAIFRRCNCFGIRRRQDVTTHDVSTSPIPEDIPERADTSTSPIPEDIPERVDISTSPIPDDVLYTEKVSRSRKLIPTQGVQHPSN